ncbi:MAG: protein-export chaperone SecB [Methylophilaceae bacterium]|nr:protein-export chaperone SecB [Methylophilaceae bacterium]MDG1452930.1 protein-export chaperone SecB [Methylophilaceae bacterium]
MAKDNNAAAEAAGTEQAQPGFAIEKLYVKDASIEVPNAPQIFTNRTAPQVSVELGNSATRLDDGVFEVSIKVTVTAKIEETTAFLVEVTQSGIFGIRGIPDENLEVVLAITCPNILFPYAREAVSDMVTRAGFMPVLLNPINFEALYAQQKMEQNPSEAPN